MHGTWFLLRVLITFCVLECNTIQLIDIITDVKTIILLKTLKTRIISCMEIRTT